jgi:hypothetical protein
MRIAPHLTRGPGTWLLRSLAAFCLLVLGILHGGIALGQTLYFHNDVLGNPVVATDAYGSVAWMTCPLSPYQSSRGSPVG